MPETVWVPTAVSLPEDGRLVLTKIDDCLGVRNEQPLRRQGRLWFLADMSMYVYYHPTHWQSLPATVTDAA